MSGAILKVAVSCALKEAICNAMGVSKEEVMALDEVMRGPEARARRKRAEEYLEQRRSELTTELSALLPEGLEFKWGPTE